MRTACRDRLTWAKALLTALGDRRTTNAEVSVVAWELAEGGGWGHAGHNPLNTTMPAPGATDYNHAHVKNYRSCEQGLAMTVKTLQLRHYRDIRQALSTGADPSVVANASSLRVWGTGKIASDLVVHARREVGG